MLCVCVPVALCLCYKFIYFGIDSTATPTTTTATAVRPKRKVKDNVPVCIEYTKPPPTIATTNWIKGAFFILCIKVTRPDLLFGFLV